MNATIALTLDTRRAKQDGTYPLIMRLAFNGLTIPIPLGYSVKEEDWDEAGRKIKKSYKGSETVERFNNLIQKKKSNALDILMKLDEKGELSKMSITDVKSRIVKKKEAQSFFTYADDLIASLKEAKRFGTAESYRSTTNVLKTFVNKNALPFAAINYEFLKRFESNHLAKEGNSLNGLAVYMRTIRAIYNSAIKTGAAEEEHYPFKAYKIKTVPPKKRALDIDLLNNILGLKLAPDNLLFNARNYFVASYMMYGMNFMDMAFLRKTDIANGRINYRRNKTSKLFDIKLFPALQEILDHYIAGDPQSEYVFPILRQDELGAQMKSLKWARKRYNAKLKLIAQECGIETNLTSYVSRHSFATQALLNTVPIAAISAMLGHSSIKTTEVYLKGLPSAVLDDYNQQIMGQSTLQKSVNKKSSPSPQ